MSKGLNLGDVLDIMSEKAGGLTLNEAMHIARNIVTLSHHIVDSVAQETYDEGYKSGHEVGKSLVVPPTTEQWEVQKFERVYTFAVQKARAEVRDAVALHGRDRKIQVIKELRNSTGLGLKDTKDIVDEYILKLNQAEESVRYSDEPPF